MVEDFEVKAFEDYAKKLCTNRRSSSYSIFINGAVFIDPNSNRQVWRSKSAASADLTNRIRRFILSSDIYSDDLKQYPNRKTLEERVKEVKRHLLSTGVIEINEL